MICCLPALYQADQHSQINSLQCPLYGSSNCAEVVVASLSEETVTYAAVDSFPAEQTTASILHFAREANVSCKVIVEQVENCQHACNYGQNRQVYSLAIQILDQLDTSNYQKYGEHCKKQQL